MRIRVTAIMRIRAIPQQTVMLALPRHIDATFCVNRVKQGGYHHGIEESNEQQKINPLL